MRTKVFYPDYNNSILGISTTLLQYYGVKTKKKTLPLLEEALKHNHKNVLFIILDGMGVDMMQHDLPYFSFLRWHIKDEISSVFPPTTTAATSSYYSGLAPIEHAWLGWSPYFKNLKRVVELFTHKDHYTGEKITTDFTKDISYTHIFEKIKAVNSKVQMTRIRPDFLDEDGAANFDEFCEKILKQSQESGNQFILAYWNNPDSLAHEFGPYSRKVKDELQNINAKIKHLCANLKDTLVIISADHGHIENEEIMINDYPDFVNCLAAPLGLDARAATVFLKKGKEETFLKEFDQHFKKDFILIKSQNALNIGLFGTGKQHPMVKDFLGDYLIISKRNKSLVQRFPNDVYNYLPSMHSGLTNKEMVVPLIIVEKK